MKFYPHENLSFYKEAQVETYLRKHRKVWVEEEELQIVSEVIQHKWGNVEFGICHGVRTGFENKRLSDLLSARVVGTDIGNLSSESVICMDFHDEVPCWKGKADFVYSNSLDHSHSPSLALSRWFECIKLGGLLIVHRGRERGEPNAADCFSANKKEWGEIMSCFGEVEEVPTGSGVRVLLIVQKVGDNG